MQPFIIGEIAKAQDVSMAMLHSCIDTIVKTGCHAVKFQTHIAEAKMSSYEPFRIQFFKQDFARYEYWKRMYFSLAQWNSEMNRLVLDNEFEK